MNARLLLVSASAVAMVVTIACSDTSSSLRDVAEDAGDFSTETSSETSDATDDKQSETDSETETIASEFETETASDTRVSTDRDSESESEAETTSDAFDTETENQKDTETTSSALIDCSHLAAVIVPADIPCLAGYVVLAGKLDGTAVCEAHEITGHSFDQISPPHEFSGAFGNGGEFYATWSEDIYHSGTGAIGGYVVFPTGSPLAEMTINAGPGSVLRSPDMFDEDYRLIFRNVSDDDTLNNLDGELGICLML